MSLKINDRITYVGKIDWELRKFHGEDYSTHRGSSYNAYLIRDEKNVLIDTVWKPFSKEFVQNLKKEIELDQIDYIVINHGEVDHSGALPELMKEIPDTPIYCTKNAIKSLKGQYHEDWNFISVKTGDKLKIGKNELMFIEAPMIHWPDTMFTYLTEDNILFTSDAFGQHYASELMYNDLVDQAELYQEAIKYYANIVAPFSKIVENKIKEILSLDLKIDMICPSHGIIWRDKPSQIIDEYLKWTRGYQEDQITIFYDTMWDATRHMAENIAKGIKSVDNKVNIKLFNTAKTDKTDMLTEAFKSKAILVGSPTVNRGVLYSIYGFLGDLKSLNLPDKKAAAFGTYGWSGESVGIITQNLKEAGFDIIHDGLKILWNPDKEGTEKCFKLGKDIGQITRV